MLQLARSGADTAGATSVHRCLATSRPVQAGGVKAKLLVCHGALDPHVPIEQVIGFINEMNGAGADRLLVVYGRAMHGLTHEGAVTTPGVAYDAAADASSLTAIRAFFAEIFGPL